VCYRGDEEECVETLVTPAALERCRKGDKFLRVLSMRVTAMTTMLDVRVDGAATGLQSISRCPYELGKLIRDQGSDCVFGRKDHQTADQVSDEVVTEEIERLCETLDGISHAPFRV